MTKMKFENFSYVDTTPPEWYKCDRCNCGGVQLYRDYNTFVSCLDVLCANCLAKRNKTSLKKVLAGNLNFFVCAIPVEDDATFWGVTSTPSAGCLWYSYLPRHEKESENERFSRFKQQALDYYTNIVSLIERDIMVEFLSSSLKDVILVCKARGVELENYNHQTPAKNP